MFDEFSRELEPQSRKRLHCNDCNRLTLHNLEAQCKGRWSVSYIDGGQIFSTYRCGACDTVCYETSSWDSEDTYHDDDGQEHANFQYQQFPPPTSASFSFNIESVPHKLSVILGEMVYCLSGSQFNLATVGLRMSIEFIANDVKCTGRNLKLKIDDFKTKGLVDDDQHELLQKLRDRGNAGAHKATAMSADELIAGMSVVGLLLEKLYNGPSRQAATIAKAKQALAPKPKQDLDDLF